MPVISGKIQNMSSVMEELLAGSDLERLKEGAIVSGLVTEIRQNEVVVDVDFDNGCVQRRSQQR